MAKMAVSQNTNQIDRVLKFRATEIRIEALKAAAQIYSGKGGSSAIIKAAKKFEEYLKGNK